MPRQTRRRRAGAAECWRAAALTRRTRYAQKIHIAHTHVGATSRQRDIAQLWSADDMRPRQADQPSLFAETESRMSEGRPRDPFTIPNRHQPVVTYAATTLLTPPIRRRHAANSPADMRSFISQVPSKKEIYYIQRQMFLSSPLHA